MTSAYAATASGSATEPMGIVSLVVGVLSVPLYLCCGFFALAFNVVGTILGFVSLARVNSQPDRYAGKGIAIAALAVNGLFLVLNVLLVVFFFGIMGLGMLGGP